MLGGLTSHRQAKAAAAVDHVAGRVTPGHNEPPDKLGSNSASPWRGSFIPRLSGGVSHCRDVMPQTVGGTVLDVMPAQLVVVVV